MCRKSSQRKSAALLDSDHTTSLSLPHSDNMVLSCEEEVLVDSESLLDRCLVALYENRGSTREKGLELIIKTFNKSFQHEFAERNFATLLHLCLISVKKGSAKEVALACHMIGLLALTAGPGEEAREIFEESVYPISQALKSRLDMSEKSSLLACLAVITFVGGEEPEHTERSMQIMWQVAHPKPGTNVATAKPSLSIINMVVSVWSFLLTTVDESDLNPRSWQESVSYFCTLLDKNDRSLRIAAGEALALILEIGSLGKFCGQSVSVEQSDSQKKLYNGLKNKIINQMRDLSAEAGGGGSAKKDLNNQRKKFRDILDFVEDGYTPGTSIKIGRESVCISTWSGLIQLNFLKLFLGGGFVKHMQENPFLHDVFGFTPRRELDDVYRMSAREKRMYKSPNSAANKARTKSLNKQRTISQDRHAGFYAAGYCDD